MSRGSIETLRTGFRARVYAGLDPVTRKRTYLRGETRRYRRGAELDAERLVAHVDAGGDRTSTPGNGILTLLCSSGFFALAAGVVHALGARNASRASGTVGSAARSPR